MSDIKDFTNKNTVFTGTDGIVVPSGTTGERLGTTTGKLRYNTTTGLAEFYTATGWAGVDAPPTVSSISGTINENTDSTITVTGTGFKTGSVVYIAGAGVSSVERALTTTYVNQTTLTAATNATAVNYVGGASFNVKVLNPSGLSGQLDNAGTVDRDPVWSTASGTIATWIDSGSQTASVSASDADGNTVVYSLASGSLPGNSSLNTSNGAITSSDPSDVATPTTYTFTINATANGQSVGRSFNIIVNPTPNGTTSARAATSVTGLSSYQSTSGTYWIRTASMSSAQQFYVDFSTGSGPWARIWIATSDDINATSGSWVNGQVPNMLTDLTPTFMYAFVNTANDATTQAWFFRLVSDKSNGNWTSFRDSPHPFHGGDGSPLITQINTTQISSGTLYNGYWLRTGISSFGSVCDQGRGGTWGQLCLKSLGQSDTTGGGFSDFPHFATYSVGSQDHCSRSDQSYSATLCTSSRRFAIYVK